MSTKMKISFICYMLIALASVVSGLIYTFSSQIMPYHQQVIGMKWEEVNPRFQMLFLAFLNGSGMAMFSLGLAIIILLFFSFRRGEIWSRWAIPVIYLPGSIYVLYIARNLHINTQASTPWLFLAILILIAIAGIICSIEQSR
ncbi:MAG: hypothetical protein PVG87_13835 [Desulfobacteraceae bacterium]